MERGGVSGRRETAVDESRKETADRVAKYQTDYYVEPVYAIHSYYAANYCGCLEVLLLCLRFPVLSFGSWSYSVDA